MISKIENRFLHQFERKKRGRFQFLVGQIRKGLCTSCILLLEKTRFHPLLDIKAVRLAETRDGKAILLALLDKNRFGFVYAFQKSPYGAAIAILPSPNHSDPLLSNRARVRSTSEDREEVDRKKPENAVFPFQN